MSGTQIADKFSCPNCDAILRFKRIPKRLVQPCPKCNHLLKLRDKIAAAQPGDNVQAAIEEFVSHLAPVKPNQKQLSYEEDPRLDHAVIDVSGVLIFKQPWREGFSQVLLERVEVMHTPFNVDTHMQRRRELIAGKLRRVEIERTGDVEEIAVNGFWLDAKDGTAMEGVIGYVPRPIVRQTLDKLPVDTAYAARINCAENTFMKEGKPGIRIFIDIAMSPEQKRERRHYADFR